MLVHRERRISCILFASVNQRHDRRPQFRIEVGIDQDGEVVGGGLREVAQYLELVEVQEDVLLEDPPAVLWFVGVRYSELS